MFGCILVPLDGSAAAAEAVPVAADVARRFSGRIVLLEVIGQLMDWHRSLPTPTDCAGTADIEERAAHAARTQLGRVAATVHGVSVDVDVRFGRAAETILEAAADTRCDLICMAAHGHGRASRPSSDRPHPIHPLHGVHSMLGGISDRIVHTSPIPVLVVRPGTRCPLPATEGLTGPAVTPPVVSSRT
jgi:nucleotide-binding universal stress UspA family protein